MSKPLAELTIADTIRIAREVRAATLLPGQDPRRAADLVSMEAIVSMAHLICHLDLVAQRAAEHVTAPVENEPLEDLWDVLVETGYLELQPAKEPAHGEG